MLFSLLFDQLGTSLICSTVGTCTVSTNGLFCVFDLELCGMTFSVLLYMPYGHLARLRMDMFSSSAACRALPGLTWYMCPGFSLAHMAISSANWLMLTFCTGVGTLFTYKMNRRGQRTKPRGVQAPKVTVFDYLWPFALNVHS